MRDGVSVTARLGELMRAALTDVPASAGVSAAEVARAEERVGLQIPPPLREFYTTVGRLSEVMESHHTFCPVESLNVEHDSIVLCREHQSSRAWAIVRAEWPSADPPVLFGLPEQMEWEPQPHTCSLFVVNMACWQLLNAVPSLASVDLESASITRLRKHMRVLVAAFGCDMMSFVSEPRGMLGCALLNERRLYLGARSDESLEEMETLLGCEFDWC